MREAVGGTWLLYFFLSFVFIYIAFIALIMNYASAYRTTNYIVSTFENTEGETNLDNLKIDVKNRYNYIGEIEVCCKPITNVGGTIYLVTSYVDIEIPLTGIYYSQPVRVESKTIYNTTCTSVYSRCE